MMELYKKDRKLYDKILRLIIDAQKIQEDLARLLESTFTFQDIERSAKGILESKIIRYKGNEVSNVEKLNGLSRQNLRTIVEEITDIGKKIENEEDGVGTLSNFTLIINRLSQLLRLRYFGNPLITHASKNNIDQQINSSRTRTIIAKFIEDLTQVHKKVSLTNTSETNTAAFDSHDFVFFNIYPELQGAHLMKVLGATRFLRDNYALEDSPISDTAHTYVYRLNELVQRHYSGDIGGRERAILVMTLRDPVYPAGGKDELASRRRINKSGVEFLSSEPGQFSFQLAEQKYTYMTSENIFTGTDIQEALILNVIRGLYRMFLHLDADGRAGLSKRINDAMAMPEGTAKDTAILDLIKLFQYPQLMLSGSIALEESSRIIKWKGVDDNPEEIIQQSGGGAKLGVEESKEESL